jgi:hypothetical protein
MNKITFFLSVGFCLLIGAAIGVQLMENRNKYEIFHYKHTYSDGSQNDMICIFDHVNGNWRIEPLQ